jgi:hypothetical protein
MSMCVTFDVISDLSNGISQRIDSDEHWRDPFAIAFLVCLAFSTETEQGRVPNSSKTAAIFFNSVGQMSGQNVNPK